jgi:uncharacterized membrane protein/protein-disulfide isomerase
MLITAYLASNSLAKGNQVPGCGPNSSCDKVLASPWAYWLGIPVSLPGLGLYAVFLISTFSFKSDQLEKAKRALNTLTLCSFAIIGAAIWFVGVQAIAIKAFCPYCCTAHASASLAAIIFLCNANGISSRLSMRLNLTRSIGVAAGLIALIAGVQLVAPTKLPPPKIVDLGHNNNTKSINKPGQGDEARTLPVIEYRDWPKPVKLVETDPNLFPIPGTDLRLKVDRLPMMGSVKAPHRVGLLFDYTCPDCRELHGFIRAAVDKFNGQLSCLMIPMPLDKNCNSLIEDTYPDHIDGCEYAKIFLAVHQAAPTKYDEFDRWLFSNHEEKKELNKVRQYAMELIGADALKNALSSAPVLEQLRQNIRVYELNYENTTHTIMPQTIIKGEVLFGTPESAAKIQSRLREKFKLK